MWNKPWKLPEGFLIGAGIIVTGLLLSLTSGPVDWDAFRWPANIITLAVFILLIVAAYALSSRVYAFRFMASYAAAVPALAYAVALTIIMGLTRQQVNGQGIYDMLSFWPFVLIYVYMTFVLGLVIVRRVVHIRPKRDLPFLLNHLGLFIALTCATLGNADMQRLKMICDVGQPEWRAITADERVRELPLAIELQKFVMETYDDGSPKRFASDVHVYTKTGKTLQATIDVNYPAEVEGWKIYQYGYDTNLGPMSQTSIFELVRDPWLPAVYTGIWMMLAGALCMLVTAQKRKN